VKSFITFNTGIICENFGENTFRKYISAKRAEWDSYRQNVSTWEIENYMEMY